MRDDAGEGTHDAGAAQLPPQHERGVGARPSVEQREHRTGHRETCRKRSPGGGTDCGWHWFEPFCERMKRYIVDGAKE
jgi:hypothetical protein